MRKVFVIDTSFIGHLTRFSSGVEYNGEQTGVIYSLFSHIINLAEAYKTNQFCFAWDSHQSFRKILFPAYKSRRKEKKDALSEEDKKIMASMYRQLDLCRKKYIPMAGFENSFFQTGCEGDDVIGVLTKTYAESDINFIIVAMDKDLYQLLSNKVSMLPIRDHRIGYPFTVSALKRKYNITPEKWAMVKAIGGCLSDEVPGIGFDEDGAKIVGIGEKTAIKYLNNSLKETNKTYKRIVSPEGQKRLEQNLALVEIPLKQTRPVKLKHDKIMLENLGKVFEELKFSDMLHDRWDEWTRFVEGYEEEEADSED